MHGVEIIHSELKFVRSRNLAEQQEPPSPRDAWETCFSGFRYADLRMRILIFNRVCAVMHKMLLGRIASLTVSELSRSLDRCFRKHLRLTESTYRKNGFWRMSFWSDWSFYDSEANMGSKKDDGCCNRCFEITEVSLYFIVLKKSIAWGTLIRIWWSTSGSGSKYCNSNTVNYR